MAVLRRRRAMMNIRWLYFQVHGRIPARATTRRRQRTTGPARSSKYRAWIRTLGCCCCGTVVGVEAAHTGSDGGAAQKSSDYSCIPLCTDCHTQAAHAHHRGRDECERRIVERIGMTIAEVVRMLNQEWRGGRAEAA